MTTWDDLRMDGYAENTRKTTADQDREIRELYASGTWTYRSLGWRYGVSANTIMAIVRGRAESKPRKVQVVNTHRQGIDSLAWCRAVERDVLARAATMTRDGVMRRQAVEKRSAFDDGAYDGWIDAWAIPETLEA